MGRSLHTKKPTRAERRKRQLVSVEQEENERERELERGTHMRNLTKRAHDGYDEGTSGGEPQHGGGVVVTAVLPRHLPDLH